jgi:hypothetical protein
MSNRIIQVPVLPHTFKLLMSQYGTNGVIPIDKDCRMGKLIFVALEKIDFNLKPKTVPEGNVLLKLKLPYCWADMDLSDNTAINLGRFMNEDFKYAGSMFYMGAEMTIKNTQSIARAFIKEFDLQNEIEIDTAKKMFYRRVVYFRSKLRNRKRNNFMQMSTNNHQ